MFLVTLFHSVIFSFLQSMMYISSSSMSMFSGTRVWSSCVVTQGDPCRYKISDWSSLTLPCMTIRMSYCYCNIHKWGGLGGGGHPLMTPVLLFLCVPFLSTSSNITAWRRCGHRYRWYLDWCMFYRYNHSFKTLRKACAPHIWAISPRLYQILWPARMLCWVQSWGKFKAT